MDILNVILLSLFSLIALFILTKLMGYRQMSEMSMFDYIILFCRTEKKFRRHILVPPWSITYMSKY